MTAVAGAAAVTGRVELTWPMAAVATRTINLNWPMAAVAVAYIVGQTVVETWVN